MKKIFIMFSNIFLIFALISTSSATAATSLALDSIVNANFNTSNSFGISVRDYHTGDILYQRNGDIPRSPASNLKILTGAAALDTLGPKYQFTTSLYYDGIIKNGILDGNLYVRGTGDPTFHYNDFYNFALQLKKLGIKQINGYVYADDTIFSGPIFSPGVVPAEEQEYYAASASAITMSPDNNYYAGTINFRVVGSTPGWKPYYAADFSYSGLKIINNAMTVSKGSKNTLSIKRASGSNEIVITGNIPVGTTVKEIISMPKPTTNSLITFTEAIKTVGIQFKQQYLVAYKKVPQNANIVSTKYSMTLEELYPYFIKLSNNTIADTLTKLMGYQQYGVGDLTNGIKVLKDYGNSIGLSMDKWTIVDGSGLSAKNKVSPNQISLLYFKVRQSPNYQTFYKGLIVGGHPEKFHAGALYNRYTDWNTRYHVIGKTGYITGTYNLSGITQGFYSRRPYLFSVMTEDYSGSSKAIDSVIKHIILNY